MSCPEGQYRGIGYTIRTIQFAKALGCPCVDTTDGSRKPEGYTDDEVMALIKQYYRVVLEWAESHDIIINVEPHGPYTTNPDTMEQILSFFDTPYLRMNLDTGNTFIAGQDPVAAENIAGCIELLKDSKWDGVLSIESEAAPGKIEQSLEWLRKEIAR
jgi:sugar phosphate isomerase/epimerase